MRTAGRAIVEELPPLEEEREDDPARGLANGLLFSLPIWAVIGGVVWALV